MSSPENSQSTEMIKAKIVRGGAWVYGQMLFTNVINLGVMAILARQLPPTTFGLVALANVLMRLMVILATEGVNQYVIYDNQEGREMRVTAAFWMDITFSTLSVFVGMFLVPLAVQFYAEPDLGPVLIVLLVRFWLDAFSKVPDALVKKSLDFQKLVVRDTVLEVIISLSSVVLALTGWGVWSLVLPGLFISPIRAFVIFRLSKWRPQARLYIRLWPRIFSYSSQVIGTNLTSQILNEGDTLLIGKFLGSELLGVYNLAWQTANIVSRTIVSLINKLALPTLAAVSNDIGRLRSATHRMLRILSIVTFPLLIGLFVVADDFILVVYGEKWQGAVLPLRILLIYAIRYAVGSPSASVYKAVGRPDLGLKLSLIMVPFYLISIWLGSRYGIVGVALGVTVVRTIIGFLGFEWLARCLNEKLQDILKPMVSAFSASLVMGGIVFCIGYLLDSYIGNYRLLVLVINCLIGSLVYFLLLRMFYQNLARELVNIVLPVSGRIHRIVSRALGV